jgi:hypothetical protein
MIECQGDVLNQRRRFAAWQRTTRGRGPGGGRGVPRPRHTAPAGEPGTPPAFGG